MDEGFTARTLKRVLLRRYPVLHIATHFDFKSGTERESALLLGDGATLTLDVLRTQQGFRFHNVDLVTLSACNTAVGTQANGREIEGFGTLAQRRGAKGVLATLWAVEDRSTGLFMQRFYQLRQAHPELTKAEALRQVQADFIQGGDTLMSCPVRGKVVDLSGSKTRSPVKEDRKVSYTHPYFWAPFILMGNWL